MDSCVLYTLISYFLDCSGFSAISLLEEASKDPEATRGGPLRTREVSRESGRAPSLWCYYDGCQLKLLHRNTVLSSASLVDTVAKGAYHLPFEPASSGLLGEGLSVLLERSDKMKEEKRQKHSTRL